GAVVPVRDRGLEVQQDPRDPGVAEEEFGVPEPELGAVVHRPFGEGAGRREAERTGFRTVYERLDLFTVADDEADRPVGHETPWFADRLRRPGVLEEPGPLGAACVPRACAAADLVRAVERGEVEDRGERGLPVAGEEEEPAPVRRGRPVLAAPLAAPRIARRVPTAARGQEGQRQDVSPPLHGGKDSGCGRGYRVRASRTRSAPAGRRRKVRRRGISRVHTTLRLRGHGCRSMFAESPTTSPMVPTRGG